MTAPTSKQAKPSKKQAKATTEDSKTAPAIGANVLQIEGDPNEMDTLYAESAVSGMVSNMALMQSFGSRFNGEVGITPAVKALRATMREVHAGNMQSSETLLYSQAVALNAMFGELACRAAINMGSYPQAAERYMRLALKAQSQSRNTLETLANIKNPTVVFARQANISNGPQQVNNGGATHFETNTRAHAPACGGKVKPSDELLELADGKRVDTRAQGTTGSEYSPLEAVVSIDRAKV
jgi:hypothetical protein